MSKIFGTCLPSIYLNRDTLHIIYVKDEDVKRAVQYMRPWIRGIVKHIPGLGSTFSKIIVVLNNNAFHLERRNTSIHEQPWFIGNEIVKEIDDEEIDEEEELYDDVDNVNQEMINEEDLLW